MKLYHALASRASVILGCLIFLTLPAISRAALPDPVTTCAPFGYAPGSDQDLSCRLAFQYANSGDWDGADYIVRDNPVTNSIADWGQAWVNAYCQLDNVLVQPPYTTCAAAHDSGFDPVAPSSSGFWGSLVDFSPIVSDVLSIGGSVLALILLWLTASYSFRMLKKS